MFLPELESDMQMDIDSSDTNFAQLMSEFGQVSEAEKLGPDATRLLLQQEFEQMLENAYHDPALDNDDEDTHCFDPDLVEDSAYFHYPNKTPSTLGFPHTPETLGNPLEAPTTHHSFSRCFRRKTIASAVPTATSQKDPYLLQRVSSKSQSSIPELKLLADIAYWVFRRSFIPPRWSPATSRQDLGVAAF
ncbi:hypothetical protein MSAN_00156700 [Mycena sanguinolenta]|uniref:Uncharacterized protein n=1 Tax=Mycena sanguinolenta TaxID=230812 RepID=A0A8H6ZGJ4_9AGAR|nr:hypothetical protein MSAN_00156700 [Mycena sanguinolenta]